ncbi:transporter substrate-binding domain-containing protein [Streptomyces virginiae]|uniref:transporter substrate-binding domain-containing protein n=1 Tax=Streptomyces virginiae TaxID=1961 RepID=UPI002F908708
MPHPPRSRRPQHLLRRPAAVALLTVVVLSAAPACTETGSGSATRFLGTDRVAVAMHKDLPGISYKVGYPRSGFESLLYEHLKDEFEGEGTVFGEPTDVSSQDRIPQLTGKPAVVDLTIASFSITGDRMDAIDFVGPYLTTRQGFLVAADGPTIASQSDLTAVEKGGVCAWGGTTSKEALEAYGVTPNLMPDAASCETALADGKVTAISTDQAILYGFAHKHPGWRVEAYKIGGPQMWGIGMRKGHRQDCHKLVSWLKDYIEDNAWIDDIRSSLPALEEEEPDWPATYKPTAATIDAYSCRDKPAF